MAQWTDDNGVFHNTDALEYGNQGDTRYWEGTPGAVGSVSYDRPRDQEGAQANFVVTSSAVPSFTAATPDTAAAAAAAAQAIQRATEAAAAAAATADAEAKRKATAAADEARKAANQALLSATKAAAAQSTAQRYGVVTYATGERQRQYDLFGENYGLGQDQVRASSGATAAQQEASRIQAEIAAAAAQAKSALAQLFASGQDPRTTTVPNTAHPNNAGPAGETSTSPTSIYTASPYGVDPNSYTTAPADAAPKASGSGLLWVAAGFAALMLLGGKK